VFERYNIVAEPDLKEASKKIGTVHTLGHSEELTTQAATQAVC
jgi:hypothetical protein